MEKCFKNIFYAGILTVRIINITFLNSYVRIILLTLNTVMENCLEACFDESIVLIFIFVIFVKCKHGQFLS